MDLIKMGNYLKDLRKEKGLTQEQFAEIMLVSSWTVSRWETGSNMPDIEMLISIADYYEVELLDVLNGERKDAIMDQDMKDTSLKVSEYEKEGQKRMMNYFRILFILALIGKFASYGLKEMNLVGMENVTSFTVGFFDGVTIGMLILGILLTSGVFEKIRPKKQHLIKKLVNNGLKNEKQIHITN